MPIPQLDQHGLLPMGVYDCSWSEIRDAFCWNPYRVQMLDRLQRFVTEKWAPLGIHGAALWVDGSFTRNKPQPADIDVVVDVCHLAGSQMQPVLNLFFERPQLEQVYGIDFWFRHPIVPNDLCTFFQYTGLKAGAELKLDAKSPKGILRVTL